MSMVVDATRSKRPIRKETDIDIKAYGEKTESLEYEIRAIEDIIAAKEGSPHYQAILSDSKNRLIEIALKAMEFDPKDSHALAEIRGQFKERFLLTKELCEHKTILEQKKSFVSGIRDRISMWVGKKNEGE